MGLSHNAVKLSFALNASLIIFLLGIFYPQLLQGVADQLFTQYVPSTQLRLYLLEGILISTALIAAISSIRGIKGQAREGYEKIAD